MEGTIGVEHQFVKTSPYGGVVFGWDPVNWWIWDETKNSFYENTNSRTNPTRTYHVSAGIPKSSPLVNNCV